MTSQTIEYLENVLRNRFYEVDLELEYIHNETEKIISVCKELGLYDLLEEIQLTK
jgi:hypothetical protein